MHVDVTSFFVIAKDRLGINFNSLYSLKRKFNQLSQNFSNTEWPIAILCRQQARSFFFVKSFSKIIK